jgi:hypothetical protein
VNSIRPRYTDGGGDPSSAWGNLPLARRDNRSVASCCPGCLEMACTQGIIGEPGRPGGTDTAVGSRSPNGMGEYITSFRFRPGVGPVHSSEEAGQFLGAKGQDFDHVFINKERTA